MLLIPLLLTAIHILGGLSAIHAAVHVRTSQGAIAWALSLLILPYVVLPLYWVFGRNRFYGYIEALRRQAEYLHGSGQASDIQEHLQPYRAALPADRENDFGVLAHINRSTYTGGNALQLLADGSAAFDAIFEAIDQAEKYLLVQFFIIRDDLLGKKLQAKLLAKFAQGVRVCLLYDEIGSHKLSNSYLQTLHDAGVTVVSFNSTRGWYNRFQLNFRNHRKIIIADGRVGLMGGLNVGDEYLGNGPLGHWRDTFLRIEGPAVQALQHTFAEDWYWASSETLDLQWAPHMAGDKTVLIHASGPADMLETCSMFFHQAIVGARKRLWIASPYFVPSLPVFEVLQLAALRGVDVRILLPAKPDHKLVYLASFSFLEAADRVGIKIYRYQNGFLHQKVVLVDDEVAAIGTANLDNRSLHLNFEVMAVVVDRPFAGQVALMLEQDFLHSRQTSAADLQSKRWPFRWAVSAARLFDPVL